MYLEKLPLEEIIYWILLLSPPRAKAPFRSGPIKPI